MNVWSFVTLLRSASEGFTYTKSQKYLIGLYVYKKIHLTLNIVVYCEKLWW